MMVMEARASFQTLCDDGRSRDRDDNNDLQPCYICSGVTYICIYLQLCFICSRAIFTGKKELPPQVQEATPALLRTSAVDVLTLVI